MSHPHKKLFSINIDEHLAEELSRRAIQYFTTRNKLIERYLSEACAMKAVVQKHKAAKGEVKEAVEDKPKSGLAKYADVEV